MLLCFASSVTGQSRPLVINTWPFVHATAQAWKTLLESNGKGSAVLNAVEQVRVKWTVLSGPCVSGTAYLSRTKSWWPYRGAANVRVTNVISQLAMVVLLMKTARPLWMQ